MSGCVDQLTKILDEVYASEGINVDYDVAAFDDQFYLLSKSGWRTEYGTHGGGTDLIGAFMKAEAFMNKDHEVDGNKMIIFFSDGDVAQSEVDEMASEVMKSGSDLRIMVIGVGGEVTSAFVEKVCGDFNIIANESADLILMDAISTMLQD